jgi:hypothetical protein
MFDAHGFLLSPMAVKSVTGVLVANVLCRPMPGRDADQREDEWNH